MSFNKQDNKVFVFEPRSDEQAFDYYIRRKENYERLSGKLPKGQFYLTELTTATALDISRRQARRLIELFQDMGIITRIYRPEAGSKKPSIFQYNEAISEPEQALKVIKSGHDEVHDSGHDIGHDKTSNTNGLTGTTGHDSGHDSGHDEGHFIKELKKELDSSTDYNDHFLSQVMELYKECCPDLKPISKLTPSREQTLTEWGNLEEIKEVFIKAQESDYLKGMARTSKGKANFDWLIKPDNRIKVLEGQYQDQKPEYQPQNVDWL